ncbi:MAG: hypothetical protein AAGG50_11745 [Bacteroidota bacterium]
MRLRSSTLLLLLILLWSGTAAAQLERTHSDNAITVGLPEGWSVKGGRNAEVGIHLTSTAYSAPPHLVIEEVTTTTSISNTLGARLLGSFLPATFVADEQLQSYTFVTYRAEGHPVRGAVYVKRHYTDGYAMLGMLVADEDDFEAMRGPALLKEVVDSAYPTARPHLRARQAASAGSAGGRATGSRSGGGSAGTGRANNTVDGRGVVETAVYGSAVGSASGGEGGAVAPDRLVGTWRVYEGGGTLRRDRPDAAVVQAGGVTYTFRRNGTFAASYAATVSNGAFRSRTEVEETGCYALDGLTLTMRPDRHDGWIYVGAPDNRETVRDTDPPARTYRLFDRGGTLVMRGTCPPYQIDAVCGRRTSRRTLDFGLDPAR